MVWKDSNAQKNGRQGHPQHGVDVYGHPDSSSGFAGVQCKGKENFSNQRLSKTEVTEEVKKAKEFQPRLIDYTIATTAPRDVNIQEHARCLSAFQEEGGSFRVTVCGWDDIEELLYEHEPPIARSWYPEVFGGELGNLLQQLMKRIPDRPETGTVTSGESQYAVMGEAEGALGHQVERPSEGGPMHLSVEANPSTNDQIRASVIGRIALILSEELYRQSGGEGGASSDQSLASAVERAGPRRVP